MIIGNDSMNETHKMYDSFEVQDPRGKILFLCDKKKIRWYIKKNLVTKITDTTFRMINEPKGPGNVNPYFLERLESRCVVCGVKEKLSKHHIVPYQYRKVLPDDYKNSNHFDVLCVCIDCHERYEKKATKLKEDIHKEYNVPLNGNPCSNKTVVAINGILYKLKEEGQNLSNEAIESLLKNLRKYVGYNITFEEAIVMDFHDIEANNYYEMRDSIFMDKWLVSGKSYEDFILMWRQHFIDTMKPKFMSSNWLDHYKTFFKKPQ